MMRPDENTRARSGAFVVAASRVVELPARLACEAHQEHDVRGCLGCTVARSWRRTAERGELDARAADPFNGGPLW